MTAADVDVVVVAYRCRELLDACLDALVRATDGLRATITVADNDSRDGTLEALRARPGVRVLPMGANLGFARANNAAIAAGSGRHVLVLNPDTRVDAGAVRQLVAFADAHPDAGVVAPRLLNPDGSGQQTARAFPTPAAGLFGRRALLTRLFPGNRWSRSFLTEREHVDDGRPFEVDWVSGAAMLVPRAVIDQVGAFDEGFFLYWEDADWCHRIKDHGYRVWCVPSARVVHDEGGTSGHRWNATTIRHFHRGAYRYWTRHHARHPLHPGRWLAAALLATRAALLILTHPHAPTR